MQLSGGAVVVSVSQAAVAGRDCQNRRGFKDATCGNGIRDMRGKSPCEQRCWRLMIWILLAGLAGCGGSSVDYGRLDLAEVSGVVKVDGQPTSGVMVMFQDAEQRYSAGVTDANGRYRLMFDSRRAGIMPGSKVVRFSTAAALGDEGDDGESPESQSLETIPECYNRESQVRAEVKSGRQSIDFDLKSDGSTRGPL